MTPAERQLLVAIGKVVADLGRGWRAEVDVRNALIAIEEEDAHQMSKAMNRHSLEAMQSALDHLGDREPASADDTPRDTLSK